MTKIFSKEDGNLNSSSISVDRKRKYSDIDLDFLPTLSGKLSKKTDAAAVRQSVKNIILSNNYEKPFNLFYGGDITGMLFELNDPFVEEEIRENIIRQIEFYEPRAEIREIIVENQIDDYEINVSVEFLVISTNEVVRFNTNLSRLR